MENINPFLSQVVQTNKENCFQCRVPYKSQEHIQQSDLFW